MYETVLFRPMQSRTQDPDPDSSPPPSPVDQDRGLRLADSPGSRSYPPSSFLPSSPLSPPTLGPI
jgi:hypothetical protein